MAKPKLKLKKPKWKQSQFGQYTFENICRLFSSDKNLKILLIKNIPNLRRCYVKDEKNKYAVSWNKYERRANFSGFGRLRIEFILQGKCNFKVDEQTTLMEKGEYCELPSGKYEVEIRETLPKIVSVCELPKEFSIAEANKRLIDDLL